MPKQWVINILEYILKPLESVEWLFDEEKHPTLAEVEDKFFAYINRLWLWIGRLDSLPEEVK